MASTLGMKQHDALSSLFLHRSTPPTLANQNMQNRRIIEISDDEEDDVVILPGPVAEPATLNRTNPVAMSTMNIRLKPDSSPMVRCNSKRQKMEDAPEASGSRITHPRISLNFFDDDDGYTQAYPAFFDDAFLLYPRDNASPSSIDTAAKVLLNEVRRQARIPPYYDDARLNMRMYCGPGHQQFPLPVAHDPKFQELCDAFDARDKNGYDQNLPHESPVTPLQQECLAKVLELFPDVEHKFVLDRITSQYEVMRFPDEEVEMHPDSSAVINEILEMNDTYPRQKDSEEPENEFEDRLGKLISWTKDHYQRPNYKRDAVVMLAAHFDHVPTHYIYSTVMQKEGLSDAYVAIENVESGYFQGNRPYHRSKAPRVQLEKKYQGTDPQLDPPYYRILIVELQAAKQHVLRKKLQADQEQALKDAELANIEQQRLDGMLVQCGCCFDDETPMNRTVVCVSDDEHRFCYECIRNLASTQIGLNLYEMNCMDESGCGKSLDHDGIGRAVPIKTVDKLSFIQQQAEIQAANIDGLVQCPLCDFKAICDPPEVDPNFSCQNPDCFKVTCRLCKEASHRPRTCEEVKKDRGLSARHRIEEARTEAMIRTCPNCQSPIIKSDGCNKMRCTCGGIICYACKLDLSKLRDAYEHFHGRGAPSSKKCPLYDDQAVDRHAQEANAAEEKAIKEAKEADETIEENELRIETGKGKAVDRDVVPPVFAGLANFDAGNPRLLQEMHGPEGQPGDNPGVRPNYRERRRLRNALRNTRNVRLAEEVERQMAAAGVPRATLTERNIQVGQHAAYGQANNLFPQPHFGAHPMPNLGPALNPAQAQYPNVFQGNANLGPLPRANGPVIFDDNYGAEARHIYGLFEQGQRRHDSLVEGRVNNYQPNTGPNLSTNQTFMFGNPGAYPGRGQNVNNANNNAFGNFPRAQNTAFQNPEPGPVLNPFNANPTMLNRTEGWIQAQQGQRPPAALAPLWGNQGIRGRAPMIGNGFNNVNNLDGNSDNEPGRLNRRQTMPFEHPNKGLMGSRWAF